MADQVAPPNLPLTTREYDAHFFEQFSNVLRLFFARLTIQFNLVTSQVKYIYSGAGSPEGVLTAPPGSLYSNTSGGAGTTLYVKETGTGNTGWVAK